MDSDQWYYVQDSTQRGPVTTAALRQMLEGSAIPYSTLVWRAGLGNWQAASETPELQPATAMPTASGSTPPPVPSIAPLSYSSYNHPQVIEDHATGAMTAFILSLVGMLPCIGFILGIIAIVMAATALNGMQRTGNRRNHGLAVAALVLGIFDIVGNGCLSTGIIFRLH